MDHNAHIADYISVLTQIARKYNLTLSASDITEHYVYVTLSRTKNIFYGASRQGVVSIQFSLKICNNCQHLVLTDYLLTSEARPTLDFLKYFGKQVALTPENVMPTDAHFWIFACPNDLYQFLQSFNQYAELFDVPVLF